METSNKEKKVKATRTTIVVTKETRKLVLLELARANKKEFGRKIRADQIIRLGLSLIRPEHIEALQEASLTFMDRFERDYRAYVTKHDLISKDEYLGKIMRGEISGSTVNTKPLEATEKQHD